MNTPAPFPAPDSSASRRRPFLGVHFTTCRAYARLYLDAARTAYIGRCPKCGAPVRVPIGEHGTSQRFFTAVCP